MFFVTLEPAIHQFEAEKCVWVGNHQSTNPNLRGKLWGFELMSLVKGKMGSHPL